MAEIPANPGSIGLRLASTLISLGIYGLIGEFVFRILMNITGRSPLLFHWEGYVFIPILALYGGYKGFSNTPKKILAVLGVTLIGFLLSTWLTGTSSSTYHGETILPRPHFLAVLDVNVGDCVTIGGDHYVKTACVEFDDRDTYQLLTEPMDATSEFMNSFGEKASNSGKMNGSDVVFMRKVAREYVESLPFLNELPEEVREIAMRGAEVCTILDNLQKLDYSDNFFFIVPWNSTTVLEGDKGVLCAERIFPVPSGNHRPYQGLAP